MTWAIGKISGAANDDPTFENYSVVSALQSLAVWKSIEEQASRRWREGAVKF